MKATFQSLNIPLPIRLQYQAGKICNHLEVRQNMLRKTFRSIVTNDLRVPKDQSTPISRLNRSDENQLNSRQSSSGSTLTQTQLTTPVAEIQLTKPSNLPKPASSTTHKQPLMIKLPMNTQPTRYYFI